MRTEFGKFIVTERIKADISATEASKYIGVSKAFMSIIEQGRKSLPLKRAIKLLELFPNVDANKFWHLYYQDSPRIYVDNLPEYKRKLIATIIVTDLSEDTVEEILNVIK